MAKRLRTFAETSDPHRYAYANDRRAALVVEAAASAAGPRRLQLLILATQELIRAGSPEDALAKLDEAEQLLRSSGAEVSTDSEINLLHLRATAGLRMGEQDNCLLHASQDACILPLQESAMHTREKGSRIAIAALTRLLELQPDSLKYRWLLNLAAMTVGEYPVGVAPGNRLPPEALGIGTAGAAPRFRNVALDLGVGVVAGAGGAIMEDFDGDGRLDLVASSWGLKDPLNFFRQLPDGTFEDRTEAAWLTGQLGGLNLSHADFDNDGDADLLVLRGGWLFDQGELPDSLLRNEGGRFVDVTEEAGLYVALPAHTGTWADFDNDGWLDLFVGAEPSRRMRHPSRLYRNQGDGTFAEVAATSGVLVQGIVKGATWGDYDNDGRSDLYVSRFGEQNLLFNNLGPSQEGDWSFEEVSAQAGVAEPKESFPTFFFDMDNDGWLDLFVGSFGGFGGDSLGDFVAPYFGGSTTAATNRLYRNRGDGTFEDVTARAGLDRMVLAMGANFGDLDGDGFLDLYLGTGEPAMTTLVPNLALHNETGQRQGRRFVDVTTATGLGSLQKGHGVAFGDIDRDGDQDIYATMGGAYSGDVFPNQLFENPGSGHHSLVIQPVGESSNRRGMGARVTVAVRDPDGSRRSIHREVGTGGSFGGSSLQLEVGLGEATAIERLDVVWPASGRRTRYRGISMDTVLVVPEGG